MKDRGKDSRRASWEKSVVLGQAPVPWSEKKAFYGHGERKPRRRSAKGFPREGGVVQITKRKKGLKATDANNVQGEKLRSLRYHAGKSGGFGRPK